TEAEIRKWLVKEGDAVSEHQNVLEVETDKAVVEMPSPKSGRIVKIHKEEGETAKVGDTLMTLAEITAGQTGAAGRQTGAGGAGERPVEEAEEKFLVAGQVPFEPEAKKRSKPEAKKRSKPEAKKRSKPEAKKRSEPEAKKQFGPEAKKSVTVMGELPEHEEEEPVPVMPAARQAAKELGVSESALKNIKGTGPGGAITKEDIIRFSSKKIYREAGDEFGPVERVPLRGLRKSIAKNLKKTQLGTVSVTVFEEADATELWELREREKTPLKERGIHLTFMPFFIKAAQHALKDHPRLNAALQGPEGSEEVVLKKYINMGVAVDTPEGLMVPVIRDVDKKTIIELASELAELSELARQRKISLDRLKGNSFTITNYGHYGGLFATPIINWPDVAILGTGRISERPWVVDSQGAGKIGIRRILPLSLTFDHRVADGAEASAFLSQVVRFLEDSALIFVESA
ncbi:MAG: dihydrolipoamide acetyltransferase family protein, partial [Nitrospiraceae bacterium]|nr:dihydrolipoamide acetyltransferase family protein [Nitrospiraceae bacterium]